MKLLIAIAACALMFGAGLFTGRLFPAHHYERFGQSAYLYDVTTGKMCNPLPKPDDDPFAAYAAATPPSAPNQSSIANGVGILWDKQGYPPTCNK